MKCSRSGLSSCDTCGGWKDDLPFVGDQTQLRPRQVMFGSKIIKVNFGRARLSQHFRSVFTQTRPVLFPNGRVMHLWPRVGCSWGFRNNFGLERGGGRVGGSFGGWKKCWYQGSCLQPSDTGGNPAKQEGTFRCEICVLKDSISSLLSNAIFRNETGSLGALLYGKARTTCSVGEELVLYSACYHLHWAKLKPYKDHF